MWDKIVGYVSDTFGRGPTIVNAEEIPDVVKTEEELEVVGVPEHGSHKLDIVKDPSTGEEFVRKKASSNTETEKEFMTSNFLNAVNPANPKCLLSANSDGSVSLLSHKRENTMDVEQFVREGRTPELLTKEVVGLADALVSDQVLGKQSDTKLANMLVTDEGDRLVFASIDHERAKPPTYSFCYTGESRFPTTSAELVGAIQDLRPPSDENSAGLAGDERAKEFGEAAKQVITPEAIKESYQKIASANTEPLHTKCASLTQHGTLFGGKNTCEAYHKFYDTLKTSAAEVASSFQP